MPSKMAFGLDCRQATQSRGLPSQIFVHCVRHNLSELCRQTFLKELSSSTVFVGFSQLGQAQNITQTRVALLLRNEKSQILKLPTFLFFKYI